MVDMGWVGSGSGDHIEKLVQSILKKRRKKKKKKDQKTEYIAIQDNKLNL